MGGSCRRAACRPLAGAHHLYDRTEHRRAPAEPALSARHRAGILLQAVPRRRPERFADSPDDIIRLGGRDTLRRGARHRDRGRMVRALLREHAGHEVQHRTDHLYHPAGGCRTVGDIRELPQQQRDATEYLVHAVGGTDRHPLLWLWLEGRRHRHRGIRPAVGGAAIQEGRKAARHGAHQEYRITVSADADDRILYLRRDRDTLIGQPADGPELTRGYLHPGQLPQP